MDNDVIKEYLVALGAAVNKSQFSEFFSTINKADSSILKMRDSLLQNNAAAMTVIKGLGAVVSGLTAVTAAAGKMIRSAADQDMSYKIMAKNMWTTQQNAKGLSLALSVMHQNLQDVAWIPELREQFMRLREESQQFGPPKEFYDQMRAVRQMGYEWQSFMLKFRLLKEWVSYYLIKYLADPLAKINGYLKELNERFGSEMPSWGNKIARVLAMMVTAAINIIRFGRDIYREFKRIFDMLPEGAQKFIKVLSILGIAIKTNPLMAAIGVAIILIDDFYAYLDGRKSSKMLAPVWKKILEIWEEAQPYLEKITEYLEHIFEGIRQDQELADIWDSIKQIIADVNKLFSDLISLVIYMFSDYDINYDLGLTWQAVKDIGKGILDVIDAIVVLLDKLFGGTGTSRHFWKIFAEGVEKAIRVVARLGSMIGKLFSALAKALKGDFKGALEEAKSAFMGFVKGVVGDSTDDARSERAQYVMKRLVAMGYTPEQAAGITGNLIQESNLDTSARSQDGNDSIGIGQWTGERETGLFNFASNAGRDPYDLDTQLDYLNWELMNNENSAFHKLQDNSDTASEAAVIFGQTYERPADEYANWGNRTSKAETALDEYNKHRFVFKRPNIDSDSVASSTTSGYTAPSYGSKYTFAPGGLTVGNINVNVAGTNATPQQIGEAVAGSLSNYNRKNLIGVRMAGGVIS